ncbi:tubulin-specific chaperone E isoform 2-T2 [Mantella aurantiaca]
MKDDVFPSELFRRRIICDGEYGTVCYVGTVPPTSGIWLGIEWDNPLRGKHDGCHEGRRYFTCSENRFYLPSHPSSLTNAFENLTALSLNQTGITWKEVLQCAAMWPVLEELHLASNNIASLERPVNCLQYLMLLNISNNNLADGNQLHALSELPRLNQLIITNNRISSIELGCSTESFTSLTSLSVDGNNILLWSFINELNKLKSLQSLNCQNNPLMECEKNPETVRQLIIAKIENLKYLNKTEILPEERNGAELDYRKIFGINWLKAGGSHKCELNNPSMTFLMEHPRYTALIEKYGAPDDEEIKPLHPVKLKNKLLSLTIKCPDKPDQQPIKKNFPESMSVQKLKGFLYRLLKVPGSELKLTYESSKMEGKEIELENELKPLQFYSIENGDNVFVRW